MLAFEPLAAEHERCAFLATDVEIREILIELALIHDGTEVGTRRERVVDLERLHLVGERGDETIVNARGDDEPR